MSIPFALRVPLALDIKTSHLGKILATSQPHEAPWVVPTGEGGEGRILGCVRGAWDLFLQVRALPKGSEVLISGVNIRHMEDIIRAHGLVPVSADLDPATLLPSVSTLEKLRTSRTAGLLVSHLFGTWSSLEPHADWARRQGLFLVEDCAQAFMGRDFSGTESATASLFSFGTIKRCTAFGGAVAFVRDATMAQAMWDIESGYPFQNVDVFRRKLVKYLALKMVSEPHMYSLATRALRAKYGSHEEVLRNAVRGFPGAQVPAVFRFRPAPPLRSLLCERWVETTLSTWELRSQAMWECLDQAGVLREKVVGHAASRHTFWLIPLRSAHPNDTMQVARDAGLDATRGVTSLSPVGEPKPPLASSLLGEIVYLPVHQRKIFSLDSLLAKTL